MDVKEIPVTHKILQWAREEAHFSTDRAAIKAGIKDL